MFPCFLISGRLYIALGLSINQDAFDQDDNPRSSCKTQALLASLSKNKLKKERTASKGQGGNEARPSGSVPMTT